MPASPVVLVDANLTPHWVPYLKSNEIEAVHWYSIGKGDASDLVLLQWAQSHGAVILTNDGDFSQIIATQRLGHPSVIYVRTNERNPQGPGEQVVTAFRLISESRPACLIVTITERGIRSRSLPVER